MQVSSRPAMSVIVTAYKSESTIEEAVRSVVDQPSPEPFEVIVVTSGPDRSADIVRKKFPNVRVISSSVRLLPGGARNAGVAEARGEFIGFLAAHAKAHPNWVAHRLQLHRDGHDAVAGSVADGGGNSIGLASLYIVYSDRLKSRPAGLVSPPDPAAHSISMRKSLLEEVGLFDESVRVGEDTVLAMRLAERGVKIWFEPSVTISVSWPTTLPGLVRDQFLRGRRASRLAGILRPDSSWLEVAARILLAGYFRLKKTVRTVRANEPSRRFPAIALLVFLGLAARRLGSIVEQLRMRRERKELEST
jgi:glycosyltransferase involved in cell wall biosynthesis